MTEKKITSPKKTREEENAEILEKLDRTHPRVTFALRCLMAEEAGLFVDPYEEDYELLFC